MNLEFETPTEAPKSGSGVSRFWRYEINFFAGKTPANLTRTTTAEASGACFRCYDTEAKQSFNETGLTFYVADVVEQIQGALPDGDRYINYFSNPVHDKREQPFSVRIKGIPKVQATGLHKYDKTAKSHTVGGVAMPQGVRPQMQFLCWCKELEAPVLLNLSALLAGQVRKAIAAQTHTDARRVSLYGLNNLTTEIWAFKLGGEYDGVNHDGDPYAGKGDKFWLPGVQCGIMRRSERNVEFFAVIDGLYNSMRDMVASWLPTLEAAPASNATPVPMPTKWDQRASNQAAPHTFDAPFPTTPPAETAEEGAYADLPF